MNHANQDNSTNQTTGAQRRSAAAAAVRFLALDEAARELRGLPTLPRASAAQVFRLMSPEETPEQKVKRVENFRRFLIEQERERSEEFWGGRKSDMLASLVEAVSAMPKVRSTPAVLPVPPSITFDYHHMRPFVVDGNDVESEGKNDIGGDVANGPSGKGEA